MWRPVHDPVHRRERYVNNWSEAAEQPVGGALGGQRLSVGSADSGYVCSARLLGAILWRICPVKDRSDGGSCITVRLGEKVSVDAEGRSSIRVAESAADCPHWDAFSEQARGGEVPEIVKSDRFQIHGFPNPNEPFRNLIRYPRSTADRIEREDVR
jgi:hypothetical protein